MEGLGLALHSNARVDFFVWTVGSEDAIHACLYITIGLEYALALLQSCWGNFLISIFFFSFDVMRCFVVVLFY